MNTLLAFSMPGGWELIIIVLVIVLFFGAKQIPELAKGLARGMGEFKKAKRDIQKEIDEVKPEV